MSLKHRSTVVLAAAVLAACQPATQTPPLPGGSAAPSQAPSAGPSAATAPPSSGPSAAPSAVPTASPSAAAKREVVLGSIYNEVGTQVEEAVLDVVASDPAYSRRVQGAGGAYAMRDVPVGTRLTITASAPGHTSRTRGLIVREVVPFREDEPNRVDFGGREAGMYYYLTRQPDISRTVPVNQATGVTANPLRVDFYFPRPIEAREQSKFDALLTVRFPALDDASTTGGTVLRDGTRYRQQRADVVWDADGSHAAFVFEAPVVTARGGAVVVELDPEARLADYPRDVDGRTLGFQVSATTKDGAGGPVNDRIAVFARPTMDEPVPVELPSPNVLWARTHHTSVRFELARETAPIKLLSVQPYEGGESGDDLFELTFDRPMRGFPEGFISEETLKTSNYLVVLGRTDDARERAAFEAADPTKGSPVSGKVEFDERDPNKLILRDGSGAFDNQRRFKLYVKPAVVDIHGASFADGKGVTFEGAL